MTQYECGGWTVELHLGDAGGFIDVHNGCSAIITLGIAAAEDVRDMLGAALAEHKKRRTKA